MPPSTPPRVALPSSLEEGNKGWGRGDFALPSSLEGGNKGWGDGGIDPSPRSASSMALIRQPVGFAVVLAINVPNGKGLQASDHRLGLVVQRLQVRAADFVASGNLPGHQFRIRQHAQTRIAVAQGVLQGRQQPLVFGKVVGGFVQ